MKLSRNAAASYAGMLIFVSLTCGCDRKNEDIHGRGSTQISRLKVGSDLNIRLRTSDVKLLKATKVEVALEDAIGDSLSDLTIIKARAELKPIISDDVISLAFPTTNEFRSGIWHITEMKFTVPGEKTPVACKEGEQYVGLPFHLLNFTELPEGKPTIEISGISVKE
jgi:hypothetical protein